MKKILAFTLAEVLVVMGIIGVVAAITIPTLSNTTNEKEVVAKVNKAASEITDAYGRARAKYGRYPLTWGTYGSKIPTRILEFMQVQTSCPGYNMSGSACMQRHAKTLIDGDSYNLPSQEGAILASGMSIAFSNCIEGGTGGAATCLDPSGIGQPASVYVVAVDIDGANNGFNTIGVDIFYYLLSPDGGLNTSDSTLAYLLDEQQPERTLASRLFEAPAYAIVGWNTGASMKYKWWKYANYILANGNAKYLKK